MAVYHESDNLPPVKIGGQQPLTQPVRSVIRYIVLGRGNLHDLP
jgi:hypothetical protein